MTLGLYIFSESKDSEFKQFLDTLKRLGIEHTILYDLRDGGWQELVKKAGYNVSSSACLSVNVSGIEYIFSKGQAHWIGEKGYGPEGAFMCSYDLRSDKINNRAFFKRDDQVPGKTGLEALRASYPDLF